MGRRIARLFRAEPGSPVHPVAGVLNYLLVCIAVLAGVWVSLAAVGVQLDFSFVGQFRMRIIDGFLLTVQISALSLVASLALGAIVAWAQGCRVLVVRYAADLYVKIIRGTPLLVQIYLFFYIIGTAWGIENRMVAGVAILSVFEGAYIAEIIRGSLLSIDAMQLEAACAVGFTRAQTLRYVVVPQLVARTLPALTGQFASVIKDSSLLSMISVIELTQAMREISAGNLKLVESYLFLGVLYLVLTLPVAFISKRLERRFQYEA